ncbi:hypothetical protein V1509DRAFT_650661 [Lipomyces kononenkoae]
MSNVLLTGATEFIAVHILEELLSKGYSVRAAIRSDGKSKFLREQFPTSKLSFAIVPDIAVPGAFDDAVKDMDYIVHTASPFKAIVEDNLKDLLLPALNGTQEVVITSSFAAVFSGPLNLRGQKTYTEEDWNDISWDEALKSDGRVAYRASKKFAEMAVWDFVKSNKAPFSVTVLNPPLVWGPMKQEVSLSTLNTSNSYIYNLMQNTVNLDPSYIFGFVDVRDLAIAHVAALGNPKAENQRIIVSGGLYTYAALIGVMQKYRAQGEAYSVGPDDSDDWCMEANENGGIDSSKAKEILGIFFRPFKDTIVDTVR